MFNNKSFIAIFLSTFLVGCSNLNIDPKEIIYEDKNSTSNKLIDIDEITNSDKYIELYNSQNLKNTLRELSQIKNRDYRLHKDSENIEVPSSSIVKIRNIRELSRYLEITKGYKVEVVENRYRDKFMPKIVKLIDIYEEKYSLDKIRLNQLNLKTRELSSNWLFKEIVKALSDDTGFSINFQISKNKNTILEKNKSLGSFRGNSVKDLIDFISKEFNLFYNIDYRKKIINFSDKKMEMFDLIASSTSTQMQGSSGGSSSTNNSSTSTTSSNSANGAIYESLEKDIKSIVKNIDGNENDISLDKTTGMLLVNCSKSALELVKKRVAKFEETYKKSVNIKITVYKILVNKDYKYEIDFDLILQNALGNKITNITTNFSKGNNLLTFSNKSLSKQSEWFLDMAYSKGCDVAKKEFIIPSNRNLTQSTIDLQTTEDYLKNIRKEETEGVSANDKRIAETGEIGEKKIGDRLILTPKIVGENIEMNFIYEENLDRGNSVARVGDNEIKLVQKDSNNLNRIIPMKIGEKRVIFAFHRDESTKYQNSKLPIDNFIIGGNLENGKIRAEYVIVAQIYKD